MPYRSNKPPRCQHKPSASCALCRREKNDLEQVGAWARDPSTAMAGARSEPTDYASFVQDSPYPSFRCFQDVTSTSTIYPILTPHSRPPHDDQSLSKLIHHSLEEIQHPSTPTTAAKDQVSPAISSHLHFHPENTKQQRRRHPLQQPDRPSPNLSLGCDFHPTHRPSLPQQHFQTTSTPRCCQTDCYHRSCWREVAGLGDAADFCCRCCCCRRSTAGCPFCPGSR
jgi:hypothetical protein